MNFLALHSKNTKLNILLHDSNLLPINVRECVQSVTSTSEKLYVQNSLLNEQVYQLSEALIKQREITTGKWIAIRDEWLLSTRDVYQKVLAADNAVQTKKRKSTLTDKLPQAPKNLKNPPPLPWTLLFLSTLSCMKLPSHYQWTL